MHIPRSPHRRLSVTISTALASALLLAACGGGDDSSGSSDGSSDPTVVRFSYLWAGVEAEAIEQIIASFNASQDDIIVEGVSAPDTQQQLTSMSASNGTFDISDHFGNSVGSWASRGILEPLDEHLAEHGVDVDDFVPAAMEQMQYEGSTYAVPITVHTMMLLYNRTLLDEAGLEVPTTMDELADVVSQLTVTEADGTITQMGIGDPLPMQTLGTLGFVFGGSWDGADGNTPTPDDPKNIEALEWWVENVIEPVGADNLADFNSGNGDYLSSADPFFSGRTAMVIDGEYRAIHAPQSAPDLDWGVAPIPTAVAGLENASQLTSSTLFIPANAQNKEAAAEFLAYLVSDEAMVDFAMALGNLPARTSLLDDPAFDEISQFDAWLESLQSPNLGVMSSAPYNSEYGTDLGAAFDAVVRMTQTPTDAMADVKQRSENYEGR